MEPQKSSIGGIIGTIIIISIIVLGGLYFWGKRIEESKAKQDLVTDSVPIQTENNGTTVISDTGNSNETSSTNIDSTVYVDSEQSLSQ